jgi:hypothetical protein
LATGRSGDEYAKYLHIANADLFLLTTTSTNRIFATDACDAIDDSYLIEVPSTKLPSCLPQPPVSNSRYRRLRRYRQFLRNPSFPYEPHFHLPPTSTEVLLPTVHDRSFLHYTIRCSSLLEPRASKFVHPIYRQFIDRRFAPDGSRSKFPTLHHPLFLFTRTSSFEFCSPNISTVHRSKFQPFDSHAFSS